MTTKINTNDLTDIITGLCDTADMVKTTYGAAGKTVIISTDDHNELLRFTKDGVSVAKAISFEDPLRNIGAQIIISAAKKTVEMCGDGTTLTSILLQEMILRTFEAIKERDINTVLNELEKDVEKSLKWLTEQSNEITSTEDIQNIATISSNSDRIGKMFKDIYEKTGNDALVTLERSQVSDKTYFEFTKGVQFDSGYIHPAFMTDKATEQAIYENAWVHIHEGPLNRLPTVLEKVLEELAKKRNVPVIIIADSFSDGVLRMLTMNKINDSLPICAIKTPGYGYGMKKNLADINAYMTPDREDPSLMNAGYVDKIVIDSYKFILHNEETPRLAARIEQLKSLAENAVEWMDSDDYEARAFKMSGSCATIYAGGQTPEAQSEEYDRLEDAIGAVSSAIAEGFVAGSGVTMAHMALNSSNAILDSVLMKPCRQLAINGNYKGYNIDVNNINRGLNLKTGEYCDLLEAGIVDPTMVLKTALLNALANTKLLVNTSFALYNQYVK